MSVTKFTPDGNYIDSNALVIFRITDDDDIDLTSLNIDIQIDGGGFVDAILNGVFVAPYTGAFSRIAKVTDGYDISINRTSRWTENVEIDVQIDANDGLSNPLPTVTNIFSISDFVLAATFKTEALGIQDPEIDDNIDLTSLPSGWTTQVAGTGSVPTFSGSGMETIPGAAGSSFIRLSPANLDFAIIGSIFTVVIGRPGSPVGSGDVEIIRLFKGGSGLVSASINFDNSEVWISNMKGEPAVGFRPRFDGATAIFRFGVIEINNILTAFLIARGNFHGGAVLLQILEVSNTIGSSEDLIEVGSISETDVNLQISTLSNASLGLNNGDTAIDILPIVEIEKVIPDTIDVVAEGNISIVLKYIIDTNSGTDNFLVEDLMVDDSTGSASIDVNNKDLSLILTGSGKSEVALIRTYTGALPGNIDLSFDIDVDVVRINAPPENEITLFGIEYRVGGIIIILQLDSKSGDGNTFKYSVSESGVISTQVDISVTKQANHTIRILRHEKLDIFLNGNKIISTNVSNSAGLIKFFAESSSESFTSKISNLTAKPVVTVDGKAIEDLKISIERTVQRLLWLKFRD